MSEIFISYKSERRPAAEHMAEILTRHGFPVWYDYRLIKGRDFGLQIDRRVREAKALVVLWCSRSVTSRWVAEEVDLAQELGVLVPVKIESCDLPAGFRRLDYIDLTDWDGAPRSHWLDRLIDALEEQVGRPAAPDRKALQDYEAAWRRFGAPPLARFALDAPLAMVEDERIPAPPPGSTGEPPLAVLAAQEWPAVRDRRDPARLRRFAQHFAGTWYAEEALELAEAIEAEARSESAGEARPAAAAPKIQSQTDETDAAAGIPSPAAIAVPVGPPASAQIRHIVPGSGTTVWFKDLAEGPELVVVQAGEFLMGSPPDEDGRHPDGWEGPQHRVVIRTPFAVGRFAVTCGEFAAFVEATGHAMPDKMWTWESRKAEERGGRSFRNPGFAQTARHPVVGISFEDAAAYLRWLGERTGSTYRLLSEAEWEYVARAGTATPFWWGRSISTDQANYDGNYTYGDGSKGTYRNGTEPVDSFAPNPWGLYQMHGNVWEWCADCWNANYHGAPADDSSWSIGDCSQRVLRGGSWINDPQFLRAACRIRYRPDVRGNAVGFRVARRL
jgi:formylglycine-generating enzyme required for sulfatase activity